MFRYLIRRILWAILLFIVITFVTFVIFFMGPNDPANFAPSLAGNACATGYCHIDQAHPVPFADAYGAGLVDAAAAVAH